MNRFHIYIGEFQEEDNFDFIIDEYDVMYHFIGATVLGIVNLIQDLKT